MANRQQRESGSGRSSPQPEENLRDMNDDAWNMAEEYEDDEFEDLDDLEEEEDDDEDTR